MDSNPDDPGSKKKPLDNKDKENSKNIRDYIIMWRGETHAYYITEYSIIETSFRSSASRFGVNQIPMIGGVINKKLSDKAARENLSFATVQSLRQNNKIITEIRWKNVKKASVIGKKLRVTSYDDIIKMTFKKNWENTNIGRSIINALSAYLGEKFETDQQVPINPKEKLQDMLNKLQINGTYKTPEEMMHSIGKGYLNASSETSDKIQDIPDKQQGESREEETAKASEQRNSKDVSVGATAQRAKHLENNGKGEPKTGRNRDKESNKLKTKIIAIIIVLIVISSVLLIFYDLNSKDHGSEPYVTYKNHIYNSDSTLTANVFASNITIDAGVRVFTNGFNFFITGKFVNYGELITGNKYLKQNLQNSYGGAGGGGGYSFTTNAIGSDGYSTIRSGGVGGATGGNGLSAVPFVFNPLNLYLWYNSSTTSSFPDALSQYLMGASGGLSGNLNNNGASIPGQGAFGIVIQASYIYAGNIYAEGTGSTGGGAGSGGGGGGVILLLYGNGGLVNGTYFVSGGSGSSPGVTYADNNGGNGGNGIVMESFFTGAPPK